MNDLKVYLVGAGPGDPELITVKARRLIEAADYILYDSLANEKILNYRKKTAELVNVGKRAGFHLVPQKDINAKLVTLAKTGKVVVRLKGGDPLILGRGGEEAVFLKEHNINFEIVPGISCINGATSYAGIPLTHRDYADNFAVATGHQSVKNANKKLSVPKADTLVYLMGVSNLSNIVSALLDAGYDSSRPIALIEQGTTENQNVITGTLNDIEEKAKTFEIKPPALIITGDVVKLREKMHWFGADKII